MHRSERWPGDRARLHSLQLAYVAAAEYIEPGQVLPDVLECLGNAAATACAAAFPDAELVTFTIAGIGFLFDHSTSAERAPRTVAAWTNALSTPASRDGSGQAGFPLSPTLAEAGYERGHLIAHASGGGLDENLFAQARHDANLVVCASSRYCHLAASSVPGRTARRRLARAPRDGRTSESSGAAHGPDRGRHPMFFGVKYRAGDRPRRLPRRRPFWS